MNTQHADYSATGFIAPQDVGRATIAQCPFLEGIIIYDLINDKYTFHSAASKEYWEKKNGFKKYIHFNKFLFKNDALKSSVIHAHQNGWKGEYSIA
jgi:hypothetical protein